MCDFDLVEAGYENADETINFGTRILSDYSNLYEIATVACLKSSEHSNTSIENPKVIALCHQENVIVSVGKTWRNFTNKECTNLACCINFESLIDTCTVTDDFRFTLIGLRNGSIQILDLQGPKEDCFAYKTTLEEQSFWVEESFFINSFVEKYSNKSISFLLVSRRGKLFRVNYSFNVKVSNDENPETSNWQLVYDFAQNLNYASFCYPNLVVIGFDIVMFNVENKTPIDDESFCNIKKIFAIGRKFLALDHDGNLINICPISLIMFELYNQTKYKDIFVINNSKREIVTVTMPNEVGDTFIQLLKYPDFSTTFSLKIKYDIEIMHQQQSEEIFFISFVREKESLNELRINNVYETDPEKRLERLVRKQKFEEAEKFAKLFNMDPVLINKAKANIIADKTECDSNDVDALINLLNTIDDDNFRMDTCNRVESFCVNASDVRKVLNYVAGLSVKTEDSLMFQKTLVDKLFKFDTFMAVTEEYSMEGWERFFSCDLIEELKKNLNSYQVENAIKILSRLDDESLDNLNEITIEEILFLLNNLTTKMYQKFLMVFIPIVLTYRPYDCIIFLKWLETKIAQMEKRESLNFPQNALKFMDSMVKLFKFKDTISAIKYRGELNKLSDIVLALQNLEQLKNSYNIKIPLTEYLKGPEATIRPLISVPMNSKDYKNFLNDYVIKFIHQHQLDNNKIFYQEITNLMEYEESSWVDRVESIVDCISCTTTKLEAVKLILQHAEVPYCSQVRKIANSVLGYVNPGVGAVKELLDNEKVQIVLRKPIYEIRLREPYEHMELIFRRICYVNDKNIVEDILQLCERSGTSIEERVTANYILMKHFIEKGNYDRALEILDHNADPKILEKCAQNIVVFAECVINHNDKLLSEHYIKIINSIFKRLKANSRRYKNENSIKIIKGVFNINQSFETKVTTYDIKGKFDKTYEKLLQETVLTFESDLNLSKVLNRCNNLANSLDKDKNDVLIDVLKQIGSFELLLEAAKYLADSDVSPKNLFLTSVLLLKFLGSYNASISDETFTMLPINLPSTTDQCQQDEMFLDGLSFARKLVTNGLILVSSDENETAMDLIRWFSSINFFNDSNFRTKNFYTFFDSFKSIFETYCKIYYKQPLPTGSRNIYLQSFLDNINSENLNEDIRNLPRHLDSLCKADQHSMAFQLLLNLHSAIRKTNSSLTQTFSTLFAKKYAPQLLTQLIQQKEMQSDLICSIFMFIPKQEVAKYIEQFLKMFNKVPNKLQKLLLIGLKVFYYYNIQNECILDPMIKTLKKLKWWKIFNCPKISYDKFMRSSKHSALELLMKNNCLDINLLKKYCEDFGVDLQKAYQLYLSNILTNYKPLYKIEGDVNIDGCRKLVILEDGIELCNKCFSVAELINDKAAVFKILSEIWLKTNFYYYEVFDCIINLFESIKCNQYAKFFKLLLFLKDYTRYNKDINQSEIEEWNLRFPNVNNLDELSEFRLPFTPTFFTDDAWNIIRPELSLKTYKQWFEIISILENKNVDVNNICTLTVKNVVTSGMLNNDKMDNDEWILYSKHENLFIEIDECVQNISDIEKATSLMYLVMSNTPKGADQVDAACLCYKYALQYRKKFPNDEDVQHSYLKVERKYFNYSAMHLLHIHKLNDQKYLNLVSEPESLIIALYSDERLVSNNSIQCPDINAIVNALGELFQLDLECIRMHLLNSWLNINSIDNLNTSVLILQNNETDEETGDDEKILKRVTYLCTSGDGVDYWAPILKNIGTNVGNISNASRAKALKVLLNITTEQELESMTGKTFEEFSSYINKISLLGEIEKYDSDMNIDKLEECDKKQLLKQFAKLGLNADAIKIIANICMTFNINDYKYWEYIFSATIKLNMMTELTSYAKYLKYAQYKPFYINGWQAILDNKFDINTYNLSSEQLTEIFIENILMIQTCPVLYSLNFEKVIDISLKNKQYCIAFILLQYVHNIEKKETYAKNILNICPNVSKNLDQWNILGLWGVEEMKKYLRNL